MKRGGADLRGGGGGWRELALEECAREGQVTKAVSEYTLENPREENPPKSQPEKEKPAEAG